MLTHVHCRWRSAGGAEESYPVADCLACAGTGRNPCGYPLPMLRLATKNRDPQVVGCSATMFEGCPREHGLKKNVAYGVRPDEAYTRAFGSLVHLGLEVLHAGETDGDAHIEERYARELQLPDGRTMRVTAAMDVLHLSEDGRHAAIRDYKVVDSISDSAISRRLARYVPQFSIQRWILDGHGIVVEDIELQFLYHKDKRNIALYPEGDPAFPDARIWALEQTEAYLLRRGPVLMDSLAGRYPPPLGDRSQNWMCRRCDVRDECRALYGNPLPYES